MDILKKGIASICIIMSIVMMASIVIPNTTLFINEVYASGADGTATGGGATAGGVDLNPSNVKGTSSTASNKVSSIGNTVLGIVQAAGVALSVIILVVIGIKYLMGSAEEKAEYKKSMIPYLIGAAIIFGASVIAGWVKETTDSLASK